MEKLGNVMLFATNPKVLSGDENEYDFEQLKHRSFFSKKKLLSYEGNYLNL